MKSKPNAEDDHPAWDNVRRQTNERNPSMIPMTSPTYRVVAMRDSTQKTVERIEEGSLVRLVIDLWPTTRSFGRSGPYATECYLVKLNQGEWTRCSDYLSTNNMIKKLCVVPKGIDPTPYAKAQAGPLLVLVEE